jgi:hypothetical protein
MSDEHQNELGLETAVPVAEPALPSSTQPVIEEPAQEPETDPLKGRLAVVTNDADTMVIATEAQYLAAAEKLKVIKSYQADVGVKLDPTIASAKRTLEAAKAGYDEAKANKALYIDPSDRVEGIIKRKMSDYMLAEQKRVATQKAEQVQIAQGKAVDDRTSRAEGPKAVGLADAAERVMSESVAPAPISRVAVAAPPKVQGIHQQTRWSAEVLDLTTLIKAVAEGKIASMYLLPNMPALNQLAVGTKENFSVPGVRAVATTNTVIRS